MEHLVPTLDTCKKLKAAGFPQEVVYSYGSLLSEEIGLLTKAAYETYVGVDSDGTVGCQECEGEDKGRDQLVAAPTAQEIADHLNGGSAFQLYSQGDEELGYNGMPTYATECGGEAAIATTMAEALALLWLKLQETK
ncbi:hypothetical protein QF038_001828 [Pseudarthrobacter sp. W1I19]|uniref:hypothetical protein n=1 Tax=Pseudarthrobacter sp. W1I19 TaxID=3042288 RepID=UPI002781DB60|nr:hypothetical protein [Pseudarthrobacter sp. W1I19]MDQ0923320.1 hypothetical protein [Pseudarthrobacter sp. W1I19]